MRDPRGFCGILHIAGSASSNPANPANKNTVKNIVVKYAELIKDKLVEEIQILKGKPESSKFSLTFDEWTSRKNKRYLNINLHFQDHHRNLGLVRINASSSAENLVRLISEHLNKFDLNMDNDIVAITTDGPNVMKKLGRIVPCLQQFCYAHGLQLAVIDVLYQKQTLDVTEAFECEDQQMILDDTDDSDNDDNLDEHSSLLVVEKNRQRVELSINHKDLIKKIRKTVLTFKNSPTKNDLILQKYIVEEKGKRLELILDCKTRWNSLVDMLDRFYNVRAPISKSLIDIKSSIQFTEHDWETIENLRRSLEPLKLGVEVLCRRDATLITAETTLKFILQKLQNEKSNISSELLKSFCQRIKQRRTIQSAILLYLQNPVLYEKELKSSNEVMKDTFPLEKKSKLRAEMKKILERLLNLSDKNDEDDATMETAGSDFSSSPDSTERSQDTLQQLQQELEKQLSASYPPIKNKSKVLRKENIESELKKQMHTFQSNGDRGHLLELVYRFLLTIPPTSVESERAFSAAGLICSQLRTSLSDGSLSSICFLRAFFQASELGKS